MRCFNVLELTLLLVVVVVTELHTCRVVIKPWKPLSKLLIKDELNQYSNLVNNGCDMCDRQMNFVLKV
jgi:hypothetical protein